MMKQQNQEQGFGRPSMNQSFGALYFAANCFALCFTPFLRRDFGRNAIGIAGLGAGGLILLWGSYSNTPALWWYFIAWLLALIGCRVRTFQNSIKGTALHSYYDGYPWLAFKLFPRMKSESNARAAEAFLLLAIGGLVAMVSKPFGGFICCGFPAILFLEAVRVEFTRSELRAMRDAEIAQRQLAEQYREGRF
jgi:hypothetical protein